MAPHLLAFSILLQYFTDMSMRHSFGMVIGLTLLFMGGCTTTQNHVTECTSSETSFCLILSYENSESSEDSNSTLETLTIVEQDVFYTWTYEGYHPSDDDFDPTTHASFTLSEEDFEGLIELLENSTLATPVDEVQPLSAPNAIMTRSVEVSLEWHWADEPVNSHVVGLSDVYEGNGESYSTIENTSFISDVERLLNFIQNAQGFAP